MANPAAVPPVLGIDIAKRTFDVVLLPTTGKARHRRFDNQPSGFQALWTWLQRHLGPAVTACHACLEATGTYSEALACFLADQGLRVSVVNPKRIAHFAKSRLARAKTDKVDAGLIAAFCRQERPAPWTPPAWMYRVLRALLRQREALERHRQQEYNRLEALDAQELRGVGDAETTAAAAVLAAVRHSIAGHVAYLDQALTELEAVIEAHVAAHPELARLLDLLTSIPGIGVRSGLWLLAELGNVRRFGSAREAAAYAGLDPRLLQSGQWKGRTRLSKQGSACLRKALYYPALAALRFNPVVREFGARLTERGKCKMAVVGAAMRKLLHLAYGVLRTEHPFDPAWTAGAGARQP
jgi:transposase